MKNQISHITLHHITVLILVKNEEGNIKQVLTSVCNKLGSYDIDFEFVIVDGNSNDKTREVVNSIIRDTDTLFIQQNKGYRNALIEGIERCKGDYILTLDGDCSHSADYIDGLLNNLNNNDLVIGSRFVSGGDSKFSFRHFLSIVLNKVLCRLIAIPVKDLSSGFRLYKREPLNQIIKDLPIFSEHFEVLIEIVTKLYMKGYKIFEVPISYKERREGTSKAILTKWWLSYLKLFKKLFSMRRSILSADYDYRAYDSLNPIQRYWQRSRRKYIKSLIDDVDSNILDIGCGSSKIILDYPNITALDIRNDKLLFLKNYVTGNQKFVNASAYSLPFKDLLFDTVISSQMIEHLPEDDKIFLEMKRVLKDDGILILGTVDYSRIYWNFIEYMYKILMPNSYGDEHITHYGKQSLIKKIEDFGFKFIESKEIFKSEIILKFKKI